MKNIFCFIIIILSFFSSCKDCETIELDDPHFNCPDLQANIGDSCDDGNPDTINDVINGNCECVGGEIVYDCPDLFLNIGDACDDGDPETLNDMVNDNCECVGSIDFDCPNLMLNIGDPCDDNNPNTENDIVDANCNCLGEMFNDCEGVLYVSRATIVGNNLSEWFFDSAVKTPGTTLSFTNLEQKINGSLDNTAPFYSSFAAFDAINNVYAFAYQFDVGTPNPIYLAETNVFNSSFLEQEASYGAPVFLDGELYAIDISFDAPNAQYSIVRIDQTTGVTTTLFTDNITVNSPMLKLALTSTADAFGNIYFLSATNLIVYNPAANSSTYVDIDESYNSDNQITYFGLEYKADEDKLLAIKGKPITNDTQEELVSITTDGNFTINSLFDIENNLGTENDGQINFELYSTTFSQCDNTYYISEPVELELDPFESFLIEIDLNESTLIENKYSDFIYGIEIFEN